MHKGFSRLFDSDDIKLGAVSLVGIGFHLQDIDSVPGLSIDFPIIILHRLQLPFSFQTEVTTHVQVLCLS